MAFTVVSGGYDSALLHFDFYLGSLLSSLQIGLYATVFVLLCAIGEPLL
jgi:hypothetical protein